MKKSTSAIAAIVAELETEPIDLLQNGQHYGEIRYLKTLSYSFERTLDDVCSSNIPTQARILELGSFLGVVSVALKRKGYEVLSADIPEFHRSENLQKFYRANGILFSAVNLKDHSLPFETGTLDCIIMCEVIEHLNFNPLPMFKELNRVLKNGGKLYITTPNQADFLNRVRLLFGKSVRNPVKDLFSQLNPKDNMIVGLHWREYTMTELTEVLKLMGFAVRKSYFAKGFVSRSKPLKQLVKQFVCLWPGFRPDMVLLSEKVRACENEFWLTESTS